MAKIPTKRHTKEELGNLQARSAMEVNPMAPGSVAMDYAKQVASPIFIAIVYLLALSTPAFFLLSEAVEGGRLYQESSIIAMGVLTTLAFLASTLLFFRKKLSRHHAAFSLLFVFASAGIVIWLAGKHPTLLDTLGL